MTQLTSAKHVTGEIEGTRCSIVETGADQSRMQFLRDLLEINGLTVKTEEVVDAASGERTFTIGVTDMVFNPVYAIYERKLHDSNGNVVTPAFYRQLEGDTSVPYWNFGREGTEEFYD